jgi:glycosyltransferase involved in cell wall biosynthesis
MGKGAISPMLSVILPVYNAEKYIAKAVDSILTQTYTNFELLIIDDGSTDNSLSILLHYKNRDARIHLISRENRGLVATLNEGIEFARGEWIARMDADDISLPHRFERQLQWLEQIGADICGSWIRFFGTSDQRTVTYGQTDEAVKMELLFCSPFAHPTVMMKTALVKKLRYDKAWDKAEDYDLWERVARAGWKMTNVPEVLLLHRQHASQITTHASNQNQMLSQKIRRRYWEFVSTAIRLDQDWIDEVMKIREPSSPRINMDYVNAAFSELLQHSHREARDTIFEHATRLYFRVAADCPDIVDIWSKLNKKYGVGFALGTKLKLCLLRMFRIRPHSRLYEGLKKFYFSMLL